MTNAELDDNQWKKIYAFLQQHPRAYAGRKRIVDSLWKRFFWVLRSGARWRLRPENQGNWNTVYKRFAQCCEHGVWVDLENFPVEVTIGSLRSSKTGY